MSSIVADIAEQIVLSGFVDWGNTYHWIAYDQTYKLLDYFTNIAISSGLGLGILTPVGPLRLDVSWPLYDPAKVSPIKLGNYEFHIGVGHAF
jgi:outer membrane protein assembly factor BamA